MNFWTRVDNLLESTGRTRKELAAEAGFDVSNIGKGIANNNVPSAETAVKIAKFLNTTTEYLVTGQLSKKRTYDDYDMDTLIKYSQLIHKLDSLPLEARSPIEYMISDMSNNYTSSKIEKK
ncbi:MAG: helix-turn-helix domain-containing protein [Treponema sp.]|nr:helix-turn-helix domain-containing protein [Treponema sp.]